MNVLEANPQPNVLEQMQLVDSGLLAGIPGGMFDWRKCLLLETDVPFLSFPLASLQMTSPTTCTMSTLSKQVLTMTFLRAPYFFL